MATITQTPLIRQWEEMKKKHPDAVLLFRVGDFYETWDKDAIECSEILGITLTRRANGKADYVYLAGFPHHALDTYLPKLVRAGKRVAICEQLENSKITKKLVKRQAVELITPGTTKLPNGLIIGPKVELKTCGFHDSDGRFMIHDNKVGIFLTEPNNKWFFAPLILAPEYEERYRLYTELSWKYSEWIWVNEYENEKLPEYYEEFKAMYSSFVEKYGPLNAPENAAFIKLDKYSDNLEILEKKIVDKDGNTRYVPGKGFEEIESCLPQKAKQYDLGFLISLLSAFKEILNKLYIFDEIRRKTQELRALSKSLGISPIKAFNECNVDNIVQPSLFE